MRSLPVIPVLRYRMKGLYALITFTGRCISLISEPATYCSRFLPSQGGASRRATGLPDTASIGTSSEWSLRENRRTGTRSDISYGLVMHDLLLAIGCRKSGGSIASFSRMRQTLVLPYSKGYEPRTEGSDYCNKIN